MVDVPHMTSALQSPTETRWNRRLWMRLATVNALASAVALIFSGHMAEDVSSVVRLGAQVQFMHSMASIACATFMNVGARRARHAPAFLLGGSLLFAVHHYGAAAGLWGLANGAVGFAAVMMASGWIIIFAAGRNIDT
jgi:uncharacterized membrane protein YgdD (TMEM256/DUF423 family)